VPEGTGLVAYAFANVANDVFAGISTLTDLKNKTCPISAWNTMDSWNDVPLSGRSDPFNVVLGQSSTGPSISFVLRRIAARLNITLTEGTGVTFSSMKLVNLPNKTYYVSRPLSSERSLTDATDDSGRIGGKDAVNVSTPTDWIAESTTLSSKSVSLYMFENRPGVTTNTNQAAKGKDNAPDSRCTYLVITGEDSNNTYEWTFYLGGDPTSNYNIKRNSVYTITATLKNSSVSDVRVVAVTKWKHTPGTEDNQQTGKFAGSNIYWNGSKLTFDGAGTTTNQYRQGVYFKWGSLVGISPAQTPAGTDVWTGDVIVYVPTFSQTSVSWYNGKASGSTPAYSIYGNIPYEDSQYFSYNATDNKLYYSDHETMAFWWGQQRRGDICQFLGEIGAAPRGYRMPRSDEFAAASPAWTKGGTSTTKNDLGNAQGTTAIPSSYAWARKGSSNSLFPAAGLRKSNGELTGVGLNGYFWSSSANNATAGFDLSFDSSSVYPSGANHRQYAFSVRCIKD
jgi:uncharacterized protein (TIGR02145 family)